MQACFKLKRQNRGVSLVCPWCEAMHLQELKPLVSGPIVLCWRSTLHLRIAERDGASSYTSRVERATNEVQPADNSSATSPEGSPGDEDGHRKSRCRTEAEQATCEAPTCDLFCACGLCSKQVLSLVQS